MKHLLFLLSGSLLFTGTVHAQAGLRLGGGLTHLTTPAPSLATGVSVKDLLGYHVGVYYQQKLTTWLSLVPEVQLSRERVNITAFDYRLTDGYIDSQYQLRLTYLNIPVLARASWGPVYVEAGPQTSILLGGRQAGTATITGWGRYTQDFDQAATDNYHHFDIGPCVGIGVKLPGGLGFSVRGYQGLKTIPKATGENEILSSTYRGTMHRQTLQASLTYQLTACK